MIGKKKWEELLTFHRFRNISNFSDDHMLVATTQGLACTTKIETNNNMVCLMMTNIDK
jgi:hypothetical protein